MNIGGEKWCGEIIGNFSKNATLMNERKSLKKLVLLYINRKTERHKVIFTC